MSLGQSQASPEPIPEDASSPGRPSDGPTVPRGQGHPDFKYFPAAAAELPCASRSAELEVTAPIAIALRLCYFRKSRIPRNGGEIGLPPEAISANC